MPRAKKKKVEVVEAPPEETTEAEEPPPPPPPPSPPKKKATVVAPESPSKTLLLKAQRRARFFVEKVNKQAERNLKKANDQFETAGRIFDAKMKALERAEKRNPRPSPVGQLQKAHKAELAYERARHALAIAKCEITRDLFEMHGHVWALKNALVHRLRCQLRVAKRAKRYRRGWSTTRVRFRL